MPRVVPSEVVDLIDKLFPAARNQVEGMKFTLTAGNMNQLSAILEMVHQIPSEFLTLKGDQYAELVTSTAAIRTQIQKWQSVHGDETFRYVPGLRKLSPVTMIRQALAACEDEFPAAGTTELNFIPDKDLRESLRRDISAVNSALTNGEWKAATVLAGSVVEALLLWSLEQHSRNEIDSAVSSLVDSKSLQRRPSGNLEDWRLPELIEVARELKAVKEDTAIQARLAKDYRNLIHPGRAQRLGQVCDRGTALAAVAALERVIGDLNSGN